MKQVFVHYTQWEDYINGMYRTTDIDNPAGLKEKGKSLLCDVPLFLQTMDLVLDNWPIAASVNLTNLGCNRRAWLGQASCCYLYTVPEIITRLSWNEMSEKQQSRANAAAETVIKKYSNLKLNPYAQAEIRF
jgi:hypothetical protein